MSNWKTYKLGDILGKKGYIRGPFGSSLKRGEMQSEGIPVYEQQHAIYNNRLFRYFIDKEKLIELKRFQVQTGDLIISCSGTIGRISIINEDDPKGIISQALLLLRSDRNIVEPKFLQYFFETPLGFNYLIQASYGSVQSNIASREVVEGITISIPDLPIQKEIISNISAIDKKIELNLQMNQTLEAMAQAIFKEWFGNFNFPGFDGQLVDGLPKGWRKATIGSFAKSIQYGYTQSSSSEEIGPKFLRITDIQNGIVEWSKVPYCPIDNKEFEKYKIQDHDIFVARTGASTGENIYIIGPPIAVFASYLIRVQFEKPEYAFYIGKFMRQQEYLNYIASSVGGSAQPNANAKTLTNIMVVVPEEDLLKRYFELVFPFHKKIVSNQNENQTLTQLRDSLLPKLMSGKIEVKAHE
jgi:type I restriction enzyme, S subunit